MLGTRLRSVGSVPAGSPPGTTIVTDPFTRADSATSLGTAPTGQTWTAHSNVFGITSNQAYRASGSGDSFATVDTGVSNMDVSATFATVGASNPGVVVRYIDASNWARVIRISSTIRFDYKIAGSETDSAGVGSAFIGTNGAILRLVAVGTSLTAYVNGTSLVTWTLPSGLSAATRAGIFANASDTRFDNFSVLTA